MTKLKADKVKYEFGLAICEKIIPWGSKWSKDVYINGKLIYKKGQKYKADKYLSKNTGIIRGITIHNSDGNADAETYTRATFPNQNMLSSRVHFYVDDREIWQNLKENEVGWHAGDGNGEGNDTTISIEILLKGRAVLDGKKAEDNGAKLCAILLYKYNLNIKNIYSHKHWSNKNCPINILPHWDEFLDAVNKHLSTLIREELLYRVQVGAFKNKDNAEILLQELKSAGFNGYINRGKTY